MLPRALAEQIAAGEVVERPASVIKELCDNAVDAGATRIDVDLIGGGLERITVIDDGCGIAADELELALALHATSKLTRAEDLVDPSYLGFRGEALASIAAVAAVTLISRTLEAPAATRLRVHPGLDPERGPAAGPVGTRVDVERLFANVPARRKFLRTPGTELSHCTEVVLRAALVNPQIAVRLTHDGRTLLELPRASADERVGQILERRGAEAGPRFSVTVDGVTVRAHFGRPAAPRERPELTVVVRRRVVRERVIAQIAREAWQSLLAEEPVACVFVDPPGGVVDVNVHPQKLEVRFADPQGVYAAVRRAFAQGLAPALSMPTLPAAESPPVWRGPSAQPSRAADEGSGPPLPGVDRMAPLAAPAATYTLRTRALDDDYVAARTRLHAEASALAHGPVEPVRGPSAPDPPVFELLDCLPGGVALFRMAEGIIALDLLQVRNVLLLRRLHAELGQGGLAAQNLLVPAVVTLAPADVALCGDERERLLALGIVVDGFGEGAVVVRAVPAALDGCVEGPGIAALLARVLPTVRAGAREREDALAAVAASEPPHASLPRFARRFMRELLALGEPLDSIAGVRRWSAADLVARGS